MNPVMPSRVHRTIDPAILYFGTPVVLVSSTNEDGSPNLAPMSSAWWLGRSCMLGFGARSQTPANIRRTGECVLNLPSVAEVALVNRLARTTGSNPVPAWKAANGYRHERDKFAVAGLAEAISVELAPFNIAVSLVTPGPVSTSFFEARGHPYDRARLAADEALQKRFLAAGGRILHSTPAEAKVFAAKETKMWQEVVRLSGLTPQ